MVSKLSTSQFRYKVTKLILYDNYKHLKIFKDFRFGKLLNLSKFPHSLFSITYKIFWTTLSQSYHLAAYLLRIHPISAPSIIFHHHPLVFAMFLPCHLFLSPYQQPVFAVPSAFVPVLSFSDDTCLPFPALLISRIPPSLFYCVEPMPYLGITS